MTGKLNVYSKELDSSFEGYCCTPSAGLDLLACAARLKMPQKKKLVRLEKGKKTNCLCVVWVQNSTKLTQEELCTDDCEKRVINEEQKQILRSGAFTNEEIEWLETILVTVFNFKQSVVLETSETQCRFTWKNVTEISVSYLLDITNWLHVSRHSTLIVQKFYWKLDCENVELLVKKIKL